MDLRKSAYLSRVVFKYKVFFKKKLSVSLQSLLLKVMQQFLSVEVMKLIDINLGSSNSVVLIKGQSMAVQGPASHPVGNGWVCFVTVTLKTCCFLVSGPGMLSVWNGPPQFRIILHSVPITLLLRNTESYLC